MCLASKPFSSNSVIVVAHRLCPIATLQKYLAVLNPKNKCFWQRPKLGVSENQTVWYDNIPAMNTLFCSPTGEFKLNEL
jgi:hypothetical protein